MSEERSTLVCGITCPLAVTEATRSRFSTASIRTSVGLLLFFAAVVATTAATASTTTVATPYFIRLLMSVPG